MFGLPRLLCTAGSLVIKETWQQEDFTRAEGMLGSPRLVSTPGSLVIRQTSLRQRACLGYLDYFVHLGALPARRPHQGRRHVWPTSISLYTWDPGQQVDLTMAEGMFGLLALVNTA